MEGKIDIDFWYGGLFNWNSPIKYEGGICRKFKNFDLDLICLETMKDMSRMVEEAEAQYWYSLPSHSLDNGLKQIVGVEDVEKMQYAYYGKGIMVVYSEQVYKPVCQFDLADPPGVEGRVDEQSQTLVSEFEMQDRIQFTDWENEISEPESESDVNSGGSNSDSRSAVMEDLEGSSDEEICNPNCNNMTNKEKYNYLRKKFKENSQALKRKKKEDLKKQQHGTTNHDEDEVQAWCSDADDENENCLQDVPGQPAGEPVFDPKANLKNFDLKKLMRFRDFNHCRDVIIDKAVTMGWTLGWKRRERLRITASCVGSEKCYWYIHASPVQGTTTFQIKVLEDGGHRCAFNRNNPLADYKYIGKKMVDVVKENPSIDIGSFVLKIDSMLNLDCSYYKARRAKAVAMRLIHGSWDEQYRRLRDYGATVMKHNPGTSVRISVNRYLGSPIFECAYYALGAMKEGFKHCRQVIGVDGCFLKTSYKGQLLSAIARDGNDNMYPLAVAYVPIERESTWSWFFDKLSDDFGDFSTKKMTFISDRQKGLLNVINEQYPNTHHRYCARHLYSNFKMKFSGLHLRQLFWQAASTASKNHFQKVMKQIEASDLKVGSQQTAFEWLSALPPEKWSRSHFPIHSKCDAITNNMCESFNNYILEARGMPIISILEECTCGMFQLRGYPCCHALSCIKKFGKCEDDYVDSVYSKENFLQVYASMIQPVPGMSEYVDSGYEPLVPPKLLVKVGRPRVQRMKGQDEQDVQKSVSARMGGTHKCRKCLQHGHKKTTCKNDYHPRSTLLRERGQREPPSNVHGEQTEGFRSSRPEKSPRL